MFSKKTKRQQIIDENINKIFWAILWFYKNRFEKRKHKHTNFSDYKLRTQSLGTQLDIIISCKMYILCRDLRRKSWFVVSYWKKNVVPVVGL